MSKTCQPTTEYTDFMGIKALELAAGGYIATVLPEAGANLISLKNLDLHVSILRIPRTKEECLDSPGLSGIPILFPPNRIDGGIFTFDGRKYSFPVNEKERNNHLHGFLMKQAWNVESKETGSNFAQGVFTFKNDNNSNFFEFYPHEFTITIVYRVSGKGLEQKVSISNNGSCKMPVGLGFHTTVNLPFHPDGNTDSLRFRLTVDGKWELDNRMLPTGKKLPLEGREKELTGRGINPLEAPLDNHYCAKSIQAAGKEFNGAVIEDHSTGLAVYYEAGNSYQHWMVYNGMKNRKDFICPEPQTWLVNAPNLDLPDKTTGLIVLSPGEVWSDYTRLYADRI